MITLIYKKGDPQDLNNYRPITLLNVDTKIIAYSLAQRLKPILHKIIHSDQNGYVKNRYIGFNIRQIQDIIDYSEKFNVEGAILFLDFSKAFDSLEWDFMYCALRKFGFQNSLIKWIKTLYTNIKGCIINNGWISSPFCVNRGIRQGCPVSAIVFVIAVEILACRIRQQHNIKGIQIKLDSKSHSLKLSQLADDTSVFVSSKQEISLILNLIEIFGSLSGLKLNRNKTEGLWLGKLKHTKDKYENINWATDTVKCLGIYFGYDKLKCNKLNLEKQFLKVEKIIKDWTKRNLTMLGRITVVKSLIIPNITYVASVTTLDKEYLAKFKRLIFSFIWNNKQEKVKRVILCNDYSEGGLRMIDLDTYVQAIHISWIKRLIDNKNKNANWKVIPKFYFNKFGENYLIFYMNLDNVNSIKNLKDTMPEFYLRIIQSWIQYKNNINVKEPDNFRKIRQELIWGNKYIKFQGKCLIYSTWINDNILFVNDLIDNSGEISQNFLLDKLTSKGNWFAQYTKLKKANPDSWISKLKSLDSRMTNVHTELTIKLISKKGDNYKLQNLSSKNIYKILFEYKKEKPIGFMKWERKFVNSSQKTKHMSVFIFHYLNDNTLKMFRWKLLQYILPCKELLASWKISDNPLCTFCNIVEDYEHFFIKCKYLDNFWAKIKTFLDKLNIGHHIINLNCLVLGYKIYDEKYYSLNFLISIILYSIHKAYYLSEHKTNVVDIYALFKSEFLKSYEIISFRKMYIDSLIAKMITIL